MIHFRFHLNVSYARRLVVIFIQESVMFTSDVLSPVHSAGRLTRPVDQWTVGQCHWAAAAPSRLSCAGSRWPASRSTQLVYRVQVNPTLCAKFHVGCTVNNMKSPRCAIGLSIRYAGLPSVILISFMYDMYFAVIVIWLCICLDHWSLLLMAYPG